MKRIVNARLSLIITNFRYLFRIVELQKNILQVLILSYLCRPVISPMIISYGEPQALSKSPKFCKGNFN